MAEWITGTEQYDMVRAAIGVGVTAAQVPDAIIALPIYTGVAEMAVKALDPEWASRTGDEEDVLTYAAIFWCASLLVPAIPQVTQLTRESWGNGDYAYQKEIPALSDIIARLRAQAQALLAALTSGSADIMPTFFTTAPGKRMRDTSVWPAEVPEGSIILGLP